MTEPEVGAPGDGHSHGPDGHGHDHDGHSHGHSHHHGSVEGPPESHREALTPGAGKGALLYFDAFSGVAGDMTIAALVDLGVPFAVVEQAVGSLGIGGYQLDLGRAFAGAIGATRFDVVLEPGQPERCYTDIERLIGQSTLAAPVKARATRIFRRLAEAEAEVHRIPIGQVHFHEVGAVDAIVDVVGAAACLEYIGAEVVSSPLPLGRGMVECRHGRIPLPAPATLLCLRGVPTLDSGLESELVTPTGAAIVAASAVRYGPWPAISVRRVGWGKGTRELPDRPNALRVVLGGPVSARATSGATHRVIEANVDDSTGELAGHVLDALLEAGALDVWAQPVTMKKGRPGMVLGALATVERAGHVAEILIRESSSLGVRETAVSRVERPRRLIEVETVFGQLPVKVSEGPFGPPQIKPEFDACRRLARELGVPVREVVAEAASAARLIVLGT